MVALGWQSLDRESGKTVYEKAFTQSSLFYYVGWTSERRLKRWRENVFDVAMDVLRGFEREIGNSKCLAARGLLASGKV